MHTPLQKLVATGLFAASLLASPVHALARSQAGDTLVVSDLSPRFLAFYDSAVAVGATPEQRWNFWKRLYDFAALPPIPTRDSLARAMLDSAWRIYPARLPAIREASRRIPGAADRELRAVATLLGHEGEAAVRLLMYVGMGERNAFFVATGGRLTVAIPLEEDSAWQRRTLRHELTHALHHRLAGLPDGWERSIALTAFYEGVATHAAQRLSPGSTAADHLEHRAGWLSAANQREAQILRGILPHLRDRSSDAVERFTLGTGAAGVEREAYYVGWRVVADLLERGWTFPRLVRIGEGEVDALVEDVVARLLETHGNRDMDGRP